MENKNSIQINETVNFGIGLPTPTYKLDVSGTARISAPTPPTRIEKLFLWAITRYLKKRGYSYNINKGITVTGFHNSCNPISKLILYTSGNVGLGA